VTIQSDDQKTITALEVVRKDSAELVEFLTGLFPKDEIEDEADLEVAATALTRIRDYLRRSSTARTELVKPLNDTVKKINTSFKDRDDPVSKENDRLARLMGAFRAKQQQERQRQYEENLVKSAEIFKEGSPIPEIVAPVPVEPERVVQTDPGSSVGFTTVWKWEATDISLVPHKYFRLDEVKSP